MARFHINPVTGDPGQCRAQHACPFGGAENHFDSKAQALEHFEEVMAEKTIPEPSGREAQKEALIADAERQVLSDQAQVRRKTAATEGARRGEQLLSDLDSTYRRLEREKAEATVSQLQDSLDAVVEEMQAKEGTPFRREDRDPEATRDYFRKGMLDSLEGRTGEPLPKDAIISIADPDDPMDSPAVDGTADAIGQQLEPGSYEGVYFNEDSGELEPAFVGVYADGTARAFGRDLRDDVNYRTQLAGETREVLQNSISWWKAQEARATTPEEAADYADTREAVEAIIRETDWTTPESASAGLDRVSDLEESFEDRGERADMDGDEEAANRYHAVAGSLNVLTDNAYYLAGRQTLPPMKKPQD